MGSGNAHFKSTVLRLLSGIDPRYSALLRLVKLWARTHGLNDAVNGTFNSFALSLMVGLVCGGVREAGNCLEAEMIREFHPSLVS